MKVFLRSFFPKSMCKSLVRLLSRMLGKVIKDPFTHFIVIGGLAFLLFNSDNDPSVIQLSEGHMLAQREKFYRQFNQFPTEQETHLLLQKTVEEEALYQEGLKLNLGQHDPVVKKRIIQKMRFVLEGQTKPLLPSPDELKDYFQENSDLFRRPIRYTFEHAYYSNESKRGEKKVTHHYNAEDADQRVDADPFILGNHFKLLSLSDITHKFGSQFSTALAAQTEKAQGETGWFGPVGSRYGSHMINVLEIQLPRDPDFHSVKENVYRAWMKQKVASNRSRAIEDILSGYSVVYPESLDIQPNTVAIR